MLAITFNSQALRAIIAHQTKKLFRRFQPASSYKNWHWAYYLASCLLSSIIFWLSSAPEFSVSYINSLFMVISAMTLTGMNTVNLGDLTTFQQGILYLLMVIGSPIIISLAVLFVRKNAFYHKYQEDKIEIQTPTGNAGPATMKFGASIADNPVLGLTLRQNTAETEIEEKNRRVKVFDDLFATLIAHRDRNSQFYGLTRKERDDLGAVEYEALRLLWYLVPAYLAFFLLSGTLILGTYVASSRPQPAVADGASPWWFGAFFASSAFTNCGLSLTDKNMVPFATSYTILLTSAALTLAGNCAYPILLRALLWCSLRIIPEGDKYREWRNTVKFILQYPRRVYTFLFPSSHTAVLAGILILINAFEWTALEVTNRQNPVLTELPAGIRALDGFFQTVSTRIAGSAVFSISSLSVSLQAIYLAMMFVSAYPIIITIKNSNVYEERSLGIYANDTTDIEKSLSTTIIDHVESVSASEEHSLAPPREHNTRLSFIKEELQAQLSHDLWAPLIVAILIMWIEAESIQNDPTTYSAFNILFESVSAYANVGLSTGLADESFSLCGRFHAVSKLLLCIIMLRGRHRGLPDAIDRSIQLPHEHPGEMEELDHERRLGMKHTEEQALELEEKYEKGVFPGFEELQIEEEAAVTAVTNGE